MDRPAVYVGTYGKYNEGSLYGEWMNPGDYDTLDEFIEACYALHKDEPRGCCELMFQDYEYLPDDMYSESCFPRDAFEYCKAYDKVSDKEAFEAFVDLGRLSGDEEADDMIDEFYDAYVGQFDSDLDFAYFEVEESCMLEGIPSHIANYFDYEAFSRDLMFDYDESNGFYFRCF